MINLVDADLIAYRASASCEPTKTKEYLEPCDVALYRVHDMVQTIVKGTNTDWMEFYLGGTDNFRKTIYPEYKANRTKPPPTWLNSCRECLVVQYKASIVNGMETDDMLGIRQTELDGESRIVSIDKDLHMIAGWHYNWVKDEHKLVSPLDGLRTFYKQLILGDGTDNIPGFDGKTRNSIPKFIQKLQEPIDEMTDELSMYNYVFGVYFDEQGNDDITSILHRNAQLLYILKGHEQYWQPPGLKQE